MIPEGTLRVIFFGSSEYAVPSLRVVAEMADLQLVVTRPPRKVGRTQRVQGTPVDQCAAALGYEVVAPERLDDAGFVRRLARCRPALGIVVAYGALLPTRILAIPESGFLNVHPSLLPRWRGAAPIERAIMAGDSVTGVSIIRVTEELDAGPIALQRQVLLGERETGGSLGERLAKLGAELLRETLGDVARGTVRYVAQDRAGVTCAGKIGPDDRRVDWRAPASLVSARIRALSPEPGAWCEWGGERLRLLDAECATGSGRPGQVLDPELRVACGTGAIRLLVLQRPGRRVLEAQEWLRGARTRVGDVFG